MQLYPAIDLSGGRVVFGPLGPEGPGTAADADPVALAERYVAEGATWLHVVDMDRAFATGRDNRELVRRLCVVGGVAVQVGGNLTDTAWAREALEAGAARVVLGAAALADERMLDRLLTVLPTQRAAAALDVRDGRPALRGSDVALPIGAATLVTRARDRGIQTLVYRDLDRDGTLSGALLDDAQALSRAQRIDVIAAGGVASLGELRDARRRGLAGVIVGRALHEARFTVAEALACLA